jgi:hypothetical protein
MIIGATKPITAKAHSPIASGLPHNMLQSPSEFVSARRRLSSI